MKDPEMLEWLKKEFKPLRLATPDEVIIQNIQNSKRYFNTHSGIRILNMYDIGNIPCQLDPQYKTVVDVWPASTSTSVLQGYPLWTLLGIPIIDNTFSDVILLSESLKNYRYYAGNDFKWQFEPNMTDPNVGGLLFWQNPPMQTTRLAVIGTKRIVPQEDVKHEFTLDWILRYTKALIKITEGHTLRQAKIPGIPNAGDDMVREGTVDVKELQDKLAVEGRWVAMASRF